MTMTPPIEPGTADQRIPSLTVPEPLGATPGRLTTAAILSMTLRASAADPVSYTHLTLPTKA